MENKSVECSVNITIDNEIKNIRIRHNQDVCDARIRVDDKIVEVKSRTIQNGGALFFDYDQSKIIITIMNIQDEYVYDCFVNGISVKDDMPWKLDRYELPDVLKWENRIEKGLKKYIISEAIKGAIVGCAIFLMLFIFKLIMPDLLQRINMFVYMAISIIPLPVIYALLSPSEYKAGVKAVELYNSYRGEKQEEESKESAEEEKDILDDIIIDE